MSRVFWPTHSTSVPTRTRSFTKVPWQLQNMSLYTYPHTHQASWIWNPSCVALPYAWGLFCLDATLRMFWRSLCRWEKNTLAARLPLVGLNYLQLLPKGKDRKLDPTRLLLGHSCLLSPLLLHSGPCLCHHLFNYSFLVSGLSTFSPHITVTPKSLFFKPIWIMSFPCLKTFTGSQRCSPHPHFLGMGWKYHLYKMTCQDLYIHIFTYSSQQCQWKK